MKTIDYWTIRRFVSSRSGRTRAQVLGKHPDKDAMIETGCIARVEGDVVTTHNGSTYRLGTPSHPSLRPVVIDFDLCEVKNPQPGHGAGEE